MNIIESQSNQVAAARVNKILSAYTKGLFSDRAWEAIHHIFEQLRSAGLAVEILSAEYGGHADSASKQMPTFKQWRIKIPFTNKKGRPTDLIGTITAHAAGTIDWPLSQYDITAYVSPTPSNERNI